MENEEQGRLLTAAIARAMSDDSFRAALIANPNTVLVAEGVTVLDGMKVTVLQASANETFLVIPDPSAANDELLAAAAGGSTAGTGGTAGTFACSTAPSCALCVGTAGSA